MNKVPPNPAFERDAAKARRPSTNDMDSPTQTASDVPNWECKFPITGRRNRHEDYPNWARYCKERVSGTLYYRGDLKANRGSKEKQELRRSFLSASRLD